MNRQKPSSHAVSGLFVFLLLGIFAVFSTVMVLLGVKAYRSAVERTEAHNNARISSAYIRSMLRADDEKGVFSIEHCEGIVAEEAGEKSVTVEALSLLNNYDGEEYITRIYTYGGFLREWFTHADFWEMGLTSSFSSDSSSAGRRRAGRCCSRASRGRAVKK